MKIALYIEDGLEQIVLTPEGDTEKNILSKLHDGTRKIEIKRGDFYECRGGWVRQAQAGDNSTMIVLRKAEQAEKAGGPSLKIPIWVCQECGIVGDPNWLVLHRRDEHGVTFGPETRPSGGAGADGTMQQTPEQLEAAKALAGAFGL